MEWRSRIATTQVRKRILIRHEATEVTTEIILNIQQIQGTQCSCDLQIKLEFTMKFQIYLQLRRDKIANSCFMRYFIWNSK